jgi:hypothetical protein
MSRASRGTEPTGDMAEHGVPEEDAVKAEDGKEDIDAVKVDPDSAKKMVATIVESVSAAKKHVSKMAAVTAKLSKKEDWSRWREGVSMALSQHGLVWLLSASGLEERKGLFSEWVAGRLEYFGGDVGAEIDWDRGGTTFLRAHQGAFERCCLPYLPDRGEPSTGFSGDWLGQHFLGCIRGFGKGMQSEQC